MKFKLFLESRSILHWNVTFGQADVENGIPFIWFYNPSLGLFYVLFNNLIYCNNNFITSIEIPMNQTGIWHLNIIDYLIDSDYEGLKIFKNDDITLLNSNIFGRIYKSKLDIRIYPCDYFDSLMQKRFDYQVKLCIDAIHKYIIPNI